MALKDVSDIEVCRATQDWRDAGKFIHELLAERTGQPEKVCFRALERACRRDLVDYGVSMRTAWLTEKGKLLLAELPY